MASTGPCPFTKPEPPTTFGSVVAFAPTYQPLQELETGLGINSLKILFFSKTKKMAIHGGKSAQRNICMDMNERRLCVLVIILLHRIFFFSDLKRGDLNLKSSTF